MKDSSYNKPDKDFSKFPNLVSARAAIVRLRVCIRHQKKENAPKSKHSYFYILDFDMILMTGNSSFSNTKFVLSNVFRVTSFCHRQGSEYEQQ